MNTQNISLLETNTLELHYWLNDQTHTMDAFIHNECEAEFLRLIKEVALTFNLQIVVETEPLAEGGIRRWFKVISKNENGKAIIATALVINIVGAVFVTPITTAISEVTKHAIERFYEDTELKELEKEKYKAEIESLKVETEYKRQKLNVNTKIIKSRSNFFEKLDKCPKVEKVSLILENNSKKALNNESFIEHADFKKYVLASDDLDVETIDNAVIEIISPVLKKGDYKWRGVYDGEIISFTMKSNEFKTLVQTGKIEFKNGSSIKCFLNISKKLDANGDIQITGYEILRVNEYFENDKPVETPEGRKYRQKQEADTRQTRLFAEGEF